MSRRVEAVGCREEPLSRPLVDVRLDGLSTRGGRPPGLAAVSLHIRYGEFFTVLGPRHSGKTDVLRAIAGFLPLSAGRVLVDGRDIGGEPPGRRGVGYVIQGGALWPHLSAREHVLFGLRLLDIPPAEADRRAAVVLARLGLAAVAGQRPPELSLDHRRRLALARALAVEPQVLLLDEPLANLDPVARKILRLELAKLHRDLAVTTVQATRDAADALALSDRIAVIGGGRILQVGEPVDLYQRPASRAVAEALGPATFLPVRVVEVRELGVVVESERGDRVPVAGLGAFREGDRGLLVLRPESLGLVEPAMGRGPGITGHVSLRVFEGARQLYEVDIGASVLLRVEVAAVTDERMFRVGDRVRVEFSSETAVIVPDEPVVASRPT